MLGLRTCVTPPSILQCFLTDCFSVYTEQASLLGTGESLGCFPVVGDRKAPSLQMICNVVSRSHFSWACTSGPTAHFALCPLLSCLLGESLRGCVCVCAPRAYEPVSGKPPTPNKSLDSYKSYTVSSGQQGCRRWHLISTTVGQQSAPAPPSAEIRIYTYLVV